jgi:hypothetical protein
MVFSRRSLAKNAWFQAIVSAASAVCFSLRDFVAKEVFVALLYSP